MNDLLHRMQNNWEVLAGLTEEKVAFLLKHIKWVERFNGDGAWIGKGELKYIRDNDVAYRISPDYQPEPEYERRERFTDTDNMFCIRINGSPLGISVAVNFPDFYRFEYADGTLLRKPIRANNGQNEWATAVLFRKGE